LREDENTTVGGLYATALKKLYGARLTTPSIDIVETNAMGRGTTTPVSIKLKRSNVRGSIIIVTVSCMAARRAAPVAWNTEGMVRRHHIAFTRQFDGRCKISATFY
jgi:hypothetical protein